MKPSERKWCQHIAWRKDCKSWFIYHHSQATGCITYLPIFDDYNYCPICGTPKPKAE